jgi:high-affinity iron transporter
LEYGLWHSQPFPELKAVVAKLDVAVHGLIASFPKLPTPPTDLPLRAHEILENTLQFEITGETDMGSNTNLATAWANAQGTEAVLSALSPLLNSRIPGQLPAIDAAVAKLATLLVSYRHVNGTWASLQALSTPQREQLDAVLSGTLELLSVIPGNLEIQGDDNDG